MNLNDKNKILNLTIQIEIKPKLHNTTNKRDIDRKEKNKTIYKIEEKNSRRFKRFFIQIVSIYFLFFEI